MTKIGDGGELPQKQAVELAHQDIENSSMKFLNALGAYENDRNLSSGDKNHLKDLMDQHLEVIRAAVTELKRAGIYKQEVKVENDYNDYMSKGDSQSYAALEHDIQTLRDYNQLP